MKRIVQADPKDISIPTAVEGVQDFIDKEREIFMDLETLERIKSKTTGITMGVAAQTQEQKAMAFLTASWNEMHGNDGRTETKDGREPS